MADKNNDYAMTLFEACEYLNKSSRTISRYIRRGVLHPLAIKSRQGTLEYRFSKTELEAIKKENDEARQVEFDNSVPNYSMPLGAQFANASYVPSMPAQAAFIPNAPYGGVGLGMESEAPQATRPQQPRVEPEVAVSHDTAADPTKDKDIISLLKETTDMLRGQLQVKDGQIKALGDKIDQLIERGRETNILLKGMQDKILRLGHPAETNEEIIAGVKRDDTVVADVPNEIVNPAEAQPVQNISKLKKRAENNQRDKNSKIKTPDTKKNFFGRLFS